MFLIKDKSYLLSLPLFWLMLYSIQNWQDPVSPGAGVLLYLLFSHLLVQHGYCTACMIKNIGARDLTMLNALGLASRAIFFPAFFTLLLYHDTDTGFTVFSALLLLALLTLLVCRAKNFYRCFEDVDDDRKFGSMSARRFFFSRYPPLRRSDMIGFDLALYFLYASALLAFVYPHG